MDVLEDENRRGLLRQRFDQSASREEQRVPVADLVTAAGADQQREMRRDFCRFAVEQARDRTLELFDGRSRGVRVEHACDLLQLGPERTVRRDLAVGERTASDHPRSFIRGKTGELAREPRLADSRGTEHRDQVRASLGDDPFPDSAEHRELGDATEHRDAPLCTLAGRNSSGNGAPHPDRGLLSLGDDRVCLLEVDHGACRPIGLVADQDAVRRCRFLHPRRRVHHVARHHSLPLRHARSEGHERLAGVDRDPHLEIEVGIGRIHRLNSPAHRQCGANSALRVVAVGDGHAEHRHDRVADELLDGSAERFDLIAHAREVRSENRAHVLRVELLGARSEADQIGKENRDDLALLRQAVRSGGQRLGASEAELRYRRVLLAAIRASRHDRRVRAEQDLV